RGHGRGLGRAAPYRAGNGGYLMKKVASATLVALGLSVSAASAADMMPVKAPAAAPVAAPTSPWDIAFGGALMSDYEFRGITQSAHKASVAAYSELRYN